MGTIQLYDCTLRDGTQREGLSLTLSDKLKIAQALDRLGIDYIEGGWPGSNPKDIAFFERARTLGLAHAKVSAFGSTRRADTPVADDPQIQLLLAAETPVVAVFGKSWELHVTEVLQTTRQENLHMIADSVAHVRAHGREVIYDAEHFFDGYLADADYALATLHAAARAGASVLVGVHALVDFSVQIPAVAVTYAAILGMGCAQASRSGRSSSLRSRARGVR